MFLIKSDSSLPGKLSTFKTVTWQPVDEAPVAKLQVTVILPLSSMTAVEDWRPVVSEDM